MFFWTGHIKYLTCSSIRPLAAAIFSKGKISRLAKLINDFNHLKDQYVFKYQASPEMPGRESFFYDKFHIQDYVEELNQFFKPLYEWPSTALYITESIVAYLFKTTIDNINKKQIIADAAVVFLSSGYDIKALLKSLYLINAYIIKTFHYLQPKLFHNWLL